MVYFSDPIDQCKFIERRDFAIIYKNGSLSTKWSRRSRVPTRDEIGEIYRNIHKRQFSVKLTETVRFVNRWLLRTPRSIS